MNIFAVLEIAVVVLVVVFFLTQIIIPIFRGRPLFPIFSRQSSLLKKQAEARQRRDEEKLKRETK